MRWFSLVFVVAIACYGQPASPLVSATRDGDVAAARAATARGADPNAPEGVNGWTPLEHAVHKHQLATLVALLDAGADPNRADRGGRTPLMLAAGYGYTDMVTVLMQHGADASLRDLDNATALNYAIEGMSDIDRYTLFDCQRETVRELMCTWHAPIGEPSIVGRFKRCHW